MSVCRDGHSKYSEMTMANMLVMMMNGVSRDDDNDGDGVRVNESDSMILNMTVLAVCGCSPRK